MNQYDVIIIGAGSTGLMAANHLARFNINFSIVYRPVSIPGCISCVKKHPSPGQFQKLNFYLNYCT